MKWQCCVGFSTAFVILNEGRVKGWVFFERMKGFHLNSLNHIPIANIKTFLTEKWKADYIAEEWAKHRLIIHVSLSIIEYIQNLFLHFSYKITKDIPDSHAVKFWFWIWAKHPIDIQCMLWEKCRFERIYGYIMYLATRLCM